MASTIHCTTGLSFPLPGLVEGILERIIRRFGESGGLVLRWAIFSIKQVDP